MLVSAYDGTFSTSDGLYHAIIIERPSADSDENIPRRVYTFHGVKKLVGLCLDEHHLLMKE
ncbi:unnamed protein product [Fusarium venenatum]|uniref:Uncharacterized protein n=1 Tax=Fusarium venenatum TaxID=56646 RepID=A0A2L2T1S3_9HYPO|nr:uncharacterized protein FVRRES_01056 [Fusarium venenatum]CEI64544.1 unnamed protein product [Fusarium venenatum]